MVTTRMRLAGVLLTLVMTAPVALAEVTPQVRSELKAEAGASHVRLFRSETSEEERLLEQGFFDPSGRITERVLYTEDGEFSRRIRFTYNDAGDLSGWESRDADGELQWRYVYVYDDDHRVTQEISYDAHGNIEGTELYSYDDDQLVEEAAYTGEGLPQWRKVYEHDEHSGEIEWAVYFEDGRLLKQGTKFSNPVGRVVREQMRDEVDETFEEVAYSYDAEGRVVRARVNDSEGDLRRVHEYEYDDHGNLILEKERDIPGDSVDKTRNDYRYDQHGNWIELVRTETRIDSEGNETVDEVRFRREIEYH